MRPLVIKTNGEPKSHRADHVDRNNSDCQNEKGFAVLLPRSRQHKEEWQENCGKAAPKQQSDEAAPAVEAKSGMNKEKS